MDVRWALAWVLMSGCAFNSGGEGSAGAGASEGDGGTSEATGDPASSTGAGSTTDRATSASSTTTGGSTTASTSEGTSASASTSGESESTSTMGSTSDGSASDGSTGEPEVCHPQLAEVYARVPSGDLGREWVRIRNPCPDPLDLTGYAIGYGSATFDGAFDLVGTIAVGECFLIGGPTVDGNNFNPQYDQVATFDPQLNSNGAGVALYEQAAATIDIMTTPIDVMVYEANNPGFRDPTGAVAPVTIGVATQGISQIRTGPNTWEFGNPPTPNACPAI